MPDDLPTWITTGRSPFLSSLGLKKRLLILASHRGYGISLTLWSPAMADTHESWVDRKIREAIESGDLEPHEGVGEPIEDLDNDPYWWVKRWIKRERLRELERERAPRREGPRDPDGR